MSNNQLSSSNTVSGSPPSSVASPGQRQTNAELSLSCPGSQTDLAFHSNTALTSSKHALPSLSYIRPASLIVPASPNLDSLSVAVQTPLPNTPRHALVSPPCQPELSPLHIPTAPTAVSSPRATLTQDPSGALSRESSKDTTADIVDREIENSGSSSSDIEILLSSLGIDTTGTLFAPILAEDNQPASSKESPEKKPATGDTPPQIPPAPLQQTIPLPEVSLVCDTQSTTPQSCTLTLSPSQPETHLRNFGPSLEAAAANAPELPMSDSQDFLNNCINIDSSQKTPNVYINGLPPHFPEEQLYALAAPFGAIRSVRTFTRHVKDSESGYGFVLFETIDAAEACIMSLRRYRNLHPTFSKQVHKIPGISYTQLPPPSESEFSIPDKWSQGSTMESDLTFKEKMESLHDPTSTNLYMEGLPLSIDDATLAALVSPHRISSSRFFQTRLSNPPRIIAFVRLETRVGAEEIIERLHGRMVRGWNDTGSRISVRFADTAEQRELRRTERTSKEGEASPSRLTIAQAALLNMRGQEYRQRQTPMMPTHQSLPDRLGRLRMDDPLYQDYPLAPNTAYVNPRLRASVSTSYPHQLSAQQLDQAVNVDPTVLTLLDTLRNSHSFPSGDYIGRENDLQYNLGSQVPRTTAHVLEEYGYTTQKHPLRNGYTPTEEYIMRAHAECASQRRRPPPLNLYRRRRDNEPSISLGARGYRAQASTITLPQKNAAPSAVMEFHDKEFQAPTAVGSELHFRAQQLGIRQDSITRSNANINQPQRLSRDPVPTKPTRASPQVQPAGQDHEAYHAGHTRSSTLPHRSTFPNPRHYQHNSMSVAITGNVPHSQDAISAILSTMNQNASIPTSRAIPIRNDTMDDHSDRKDVSQGKTDHRLSFDAIKGSTQSEHRNTRIVRESSEIEQPSSSLTSPALTYSSQTPSTLSPATPFFGSFASQSDGFEQPTEDKKAKVNQVI